jgi:hypothetical protein
VDAWLLLGQLVEDPTRKSECYNRVLDLNPGNPQASRALEWLYIQPGLEMELPEKKGIPPPVEPLEPDTKPEAFPEQTLFDLDSLEPAFPSPPIGPIEEVLEPVIRVRPVRRGIRLKWVLFPVLILFLLAGLSYGIFWLITRQHSARSISPSTTLVSPLSTSEAITTNQSGTDINTPTPAHSDDLPAVSFRIVWILDNQLVLYDQGKVSILTKTDATTSRVVLSSDGEFAAFNRDGGIWSINIHESNNERLLVRPVALPKDDLPVSSAIRTPDQFFWLPGTHTLLFNTTVSITSTLAQHGDDLFSVDADSITVKQLLLFGQGGDLYPSPNGKLTALVVDDSIRIYDLNSYHHANLFIRPGHSCFRERFPGDSGVGAGFNLDRCLHSPC